MSNRNEQPNLFFRLLPAAGGAFILTVLALTTLMFGDSQAPAARFLDAHGNTLILAEVAAIVGLGVGAMMLDRVRTRRRGRQQGQPPSDHCRRSDTKNSEIQPRETESG